MMSKTAEAPRRESRRDSHAVRMDKELRNQKIKELINLAHEKGYLSFNDVNDVLPDDVISSEEIDSIIMLLRGMDIDIIDSNTGEAPLAQEFTLMLREQRLGVTLEQSLNNLARRVPTQATVLVVSAMRIASETGGGLAETLERTANTIRSRLQMEGKIGALTAQGKLQAWVVSLLPMLLMLILNHMEPEAMSYLWHTRLGWATLAGIALLESLGVYVIRRIVAIDV
jgi:tight adherence protein B